MTIDDHIARLIQNQRVDAYLRSSRELLADTIAHRINDHINDHNGSGVVKSLCRHGITAVSSMCKGTANLISIFLKSEPVYNAHRVCYSDGTPRKLTDDYPFAFGSHTLESVIRCPYLFEWAMRPDHIEIAKTYLGCMPTLYSVHAWWSIAGPKASMTQHMHRDYDDFKFVSLITYLTDVGLENGPHVFWPGTHKTDVVGSSQPLTLTGAAGTSFMADTYAFHQGSPLQRGRRLAFWARYGLYKNWIYDNDRAGRVPRDLVDGRIEWNDQSRYITRLLFED